MVLGCSTQILELTSKEGSHGLQLLHPDPEHPVDPDPEQQVDPDPPQEQVL